MPERSLKALFENAYIDRKPLRWDAFNRTQSRLECGYTLQQFLYAWLESSIDWWEALLEHGEAFQRKYTV